MSLELNIEEQELLADTLERAHSEMGPRERVAELLGVVTFAGAVAALWITHPPHTFSILPAAVCTAVLALAALVHFETPFGFTVPTQLAFVPLLFSMPLALVPLATLLALIVARLPDVFRDRVPPGRLLNTAGNARFAIGPVAVFAIAGASPTRAGAGLLILALLAQFLVDFGGSCLSEAIGRGASLKVQLRECWWVYGVDSALSVVALEVARNVHSSPAAALSLVPLLGLLAVFATERHQRLESLLELNSAYHGTALVLGDVVEADDGYTGEHSRSVVGLALAAADRLGLDAERRRNLEFAALLHDVGKIAIPKEVIRKPGPLNPEEWTVIKTHTIEGQKMLDRVGGFMRDVGRIVRSHHERWDGSGYPDALAGESIPLEARIIACCDTWNAMRTDRPYRKAIPHDLALQEMESVSGSQLDPGLVRVLIEIVAEDDERVRTLGVERLDQVRPEVSGVLEPDAEAQEPRRDAFGLPAGSRLERRGDPAQAGGVLDQA
jgi:putative nucleotidyltransferase with HDIG domain